MKWEDYRNEKRLIVNEDPQLPVECPKCGAHIYERSDIVLATYPPMKSYYCKECGWVGYA